MLLILATSASAAGAPLNWSAPEVIDSGHSITGVACPSVSLCVAVDNGGNVLTSTNPAGGVGTWTSSSVSTEAGFEAVSCASAALCVALDGLGDVVTSTSPTGGAGAWTKANITAGVGNESVACPSTELCVATTGQRLLSEGIFRADVFTSINPTGGAVAWNTAVLADGTENAVTGVGCASVALCVGVDNGGNAVTSTNPNGGSGAWTAANIDSANTMFGVSCATVSLCVAVDIAGNVVTSTNPTGGSGAWTGAHIDGGFSIFGVSCPSASLCVAVDDQGNAAMSTDPTGGVGAWTVSKIDGTHLIHAVSCPSSSLCVAVDEAGDALVGTGEAGGGGTGGGGGGSSAGGGSSGGGSPATPTARLVQTVSGARAAGSLILSAAGSSVPAGTSAASYTFQLGQGGIPITCPGPDPVLKSVVAGNVNATANLTVTSSAGTTASTSIPISTVLGVLPKLKVKGTFGTAASAHSAVRSSAHTAAQGLGQVPLLGSQCLPAGGNPPGPGHAPSSQSIRVGETAPTLEGAVGGASGCRRPMRIGIISAVGCFTQVEAGHELPRPEAEIICGHYKLGCKSKFVLPPTLAEPAKAAGVRARRAGVLPEKVENLAFDVFYYSKEAVRVDGVEIDPVNNGSIVFARAGTASSSFLKSDAAYLISSDAIVKIAGLPVSLRVPDYAAAYSQAKGAAECGKGAGEGIAAGNLGAANCLGSVKVPSLGEVNGLIPSLHGPINLSVSPEDLGIELGEFTIPSGAAPLPLAPELPLSGGVKVNLTGLESASLAVHVELPGVLTDSSGHGLSGDTTLELSNKHGLLLNYLRIRVPSLAQLGLSRVKELEFAYSRPTSLFEGSGKLDLNDAINGEINLALAFEHGSFKHAHADYTAPPGGGYPIFPPVFLTYVGADVSLNPTTIVGQANVGIGPAVIAKCGALGVQGTLTLVFGSPAFTLNETGNDQVLCADFGQSQSFHADSNGHVGFGLGLNYTVPGLGGVSGGLEGQANVANNVYEAQLDGRLTAAWKVNECISIGVNLCTELELVEEAKGTISIGDVNGRAVGGAGVCVHYKFPVVGSFDLGAGTNDLPGAILGFASYNVAAVASRFQIMLSNCNLSPFRLLAAPAGLARTRGRAAQSPSYTVPVPAGSGNEVIGVQGDGGAPKVVLNGPGGKSINAEGEGITLTRYGLYVRQPSSGQTVIEIPRADAGSWTLQAAPGSPPVHSVSLAQQLPDPKIRARVTGRGARRVLSYSVTPQPGLTVRFREGVDRGASPIGAARLAHGSIRFSPSIGSAAPRAIIADIERDGRLQSSVVVAHFLPGTIRPGRPSQIRARHLHQGWMISFAPGANATEHLLTVRFADGEQALFAVARGRHALTVPAKVDRTRPTAIEIVAIRGSTRGPAAIVTAKLVRRRA